MVDILELPEFDNHKVISFLNNKQGLKGFIAIHRKNPLAPSFGATRLWTYSSDVEALRDALRLSKMMSYKAALAGLSCGGAKGVIMQNAEHNKKDILEGYAEQINYFNGQFITGTDVGLYPEDLEVMIKKTPYIVGLREDPTEFTALGLLSGLESSLRHVFNNPKIKDRTFAIQGMGKIGQALLLNIYKDAKKIFVSDIDNEILKNLKKRFPKVSIVTNENIHKQKVDVFSPCALSNSINSKTVSELNCKIIIGGANNQLENEEVGTLLFKLGILYAPDYVVNAGGLIAVVDEFENKKSNKKRIAKKVVKIRSTLDKIINKSKKNHTATNVVANAMAEKIFNTYQ